MTRVSFSRFFSIWRWSTFPFLVLDHLDVQAGQIFWHDLSSAGIGATVGLVLILYRRCLVFFCLSIASFVFRVKCIYISCFVGSVDIYFYPILFYITLYLIPERKRTTILLIHSYTPTLTWPTHLQTTNHPTTDNLNTQNGRRSLLCTLPHPTSFNPKKPYVY